MFTSKKFQLLCLMKPYKQVCKSGGRSHNLHNTVDTRKVIYYTKSCKYCNKPLRKKSKLKMAFISNNRSTASQSEDAKSVSSDKWSQTGSDVLDDALDGSFPGSSIGNKEEKFKESMKMDTEQLKSSHKSNAIDCIPTLSAHVAHTFVTSCGSYNTFYINPFAFGYQIQHPQNVLYSNHHRNFMCRSDGITDQRTYTTAADQDRKALQRWRSWQKTDYGQNFDTRRMKSNASVFTLMTYNVLAQDLLSSHPYLYKYNNPDALFWEQRWENIVAEIKQHDADILCLQEVQQSHVETYYNQLKTLGYDGIYKKRTGIRVDGCAIYYKTATLKLINYTTVEYNQPGVFILNRDNIAVIAKFAPIENLENEFVVSTTHLLYNRNREDVRLAQTQVLLSEVDRLSFKRNNGRQSNHHVPVIITGDFNFMPNTPVYEFITRGVLRYENLGNRSLTTINSNSSRKEALGKYLLPAHLGITDQCQHAELVHQRSRYQSVEELEYVFLYHSERSNNDNDTKKYNKALFSSGVLSHHLPMKSAYEHRRGRDVEATTFQDDWITVDYIFYSGAKNENGLVIEDKLNLLSRYTLPTSYKLRDVAIPNMAIGSDHFSLVAKFKLNP